MNRWCASFARKAALLGAPLRRTSRLSASTKFRIAREALGPVIGKTLIHRARHSTGQPADVRHAATSKSIKACRRFCFFAWSEAAILRIPAKHLSQGFSRVCLQPPGRPQFIPGKHGGRVAIDNNRRNVLCDRSGDRRKNWLLRWADTGAETLARARRSLKNRKLNGLGPTGLSR